MLKVAGTLLQDLIYELNKKLQSCHIYDRVKEKEIGKKTNRQLEAMCAESFYNCIYKNPKNQMIRAYRKNENGRSTLILYFT